MVALKYFPLRFFRQRFSKAALGFFVASLLLGFVSFVIVAQVGASGKGQWFIKELPAGHSSAKPALAKSAPIESTPAESTSVWSLPLGASSPHGASSGESTSPEILSPSSDDATSDIDAQNWPAPANETGDGNGTLRGKGDSFTSKKREKVVEKTTKSEVLEIDLYDVWRMALKHNEVIGIAGEDLLLSEL